MPVNTLEITPRIHIPENEIELEGIRAQGSGGQNVNKVSSAIHLRFDINASSLPEEHKQTLLNLRDQRITSQGIIIIKSQQYRSQEKNRHAALQRLADLIRQAITPRKPRKETKPSKAAKIRRVESKTRQGQKKSLRQKPTID